MVSDAGRRMAKQGLIAILICFGIYLFLVRPIWGAKKGLLERELEEKSTLIKEYVSKEGWPPSAEAYNLLARQKESLEGDAKALGELIDPPKVYLPESVLEPRLYFKERLYGVKKRLDDGARERGIELPPNLGFSEELPEPEMVPILLRRLETVGSLVTILIEKGATSIGLIKPLEPTQTLDPQTNQPIYKEMPLQLKLECPTATLVEFLYEVRKASPVLVVKELKIKSGQGESLEVEVLISEVAIE